MGVAVDLVRAVGIMCEAGFAPESGAGIALLRHKPEAGVPALLPTQPEAFLLGDIDRYSEGCGGSDYGVGLVFQRLYAC